MKTLFRRFASRHWAAELLTRQKLEDVGIIRPQIVLERWTRHQRNMTDDFTFLWTILMLLAWHEQWKPSG